MEHPNDYYYQEHEFAYHTDVADIVKCSDKVCSAVNSVNHYDSGPKIPCRVHNHSTNSQSSRIAEKTFPDYFKCRFCVMNMEV